ncbi:ABC transporter ATP-binding protein [Spiractinospora alimapuensis]|uniref:ABC transporter ATP-binding protein n=1 Tax=Spiractinospora alimapuensis TaxID=2820884 RepID=UPI001F2CC6E0|nr:ABC transporter ATP-binding protein [Spiractinospora alimapuensis]QVQ51451.1 ABC transporter ATP-binding protein [Spiractinospora alimapuensis]
MTETQDSARRSPAEPVLSVADLAVRFQTEDGPFQAVSGIDLELHPAEVVAVVGESGSGKSVSAMSVLGLVPRQTSVAGSATLAGQELIGLDARSLRELRGREVAVVFQEPTTSLNPLFTVGWQLREVLTRHMGMSRRQANDRAAELLDLVGLDDPRRRLRSYPHQFSGGQLQRVMIAMAVACDPRVLIADEPTTALDVTVQAEILDLLRDLKSRLGTAILLITHDMGVVADIAERVLVMHQGHVVESGDVRQVLTAPRHEYTRRLLRSVPRLGGGPGLSGGEMSVGEGPEQASLRAEETESDPGPEDTAPIVLEVNDLVVDYGAFRAVDHVRLEIRAGEIHGLVGESGSGKSTVGRCAAGLISPSSGSITVNGREITGLSRRQIRPMRRDFQIVFQNPASSLNPRMTIGASVGEPLRRFNVARGDELIHRVDELLRSVALDPAMRHRYPHQLSGGQRQRVSIARALSLEPSLLIADEPTSALDVSVQAEVLDLLRDLQRRLEFACLFISHDLAVVELLAAHVDVMRSGRVVESGPTARVLRAPEHPYTQALLAAAPVPDPDEQRGRRESR